MTPGSVRRSSPIIYYGTTDIRIYGIPSIAIYGGPHSHVHVGSNRKKAIPSRRRRRYLDTELSISSTPYPNRLRWRRQDAWRPVARQHRGRRDRPRSEARPAPQVAPQVVSPRIPPAPPGPEAILKSRDIPPEQRILAPALVSRVNEATANMIDSAKAIATRRLPSRDTAIVFERSNDEGWFHRDDLWARRGLTASSTDPPPLAATRPKVVIRNISAKVPTSDLAEVREELARTANITITELRRLYSRERNPATGCLRVTVATTRGPYQLRDTSDS